MDTYFVVVALVGGTEIRFGPYLLLDNATEIFMNHLDKLLRVRCQPTPSEYTAQLCEQCIDTDGWATVAIKLVEERKLR